MRELARRQRLRGWNPPPLSPATGGLSSRRSGTSAAGCPMRSSTSQAARARAKHAGGGPTGASAGQVALLSTWWQVKDSNLRSFRDGFAAHRAVGPKAQAPRWALNFATSSHCRSADPWPSLITELVSEFGLSGAAIPMRRQAEQVIPPAPGAPLRPDRATYWNGLTMVRPGVLAKSLTLRVASS
jgi:hypothetical protein